MHVKEVLELLSEGGINMVKVNRSLDRQICCLESGASRECHRQGLVRPSLYTEVSWSLNTLCVMVQAQKCLRSQAMEKLLGHFGMLILYPASTGILCFLGCVRWIFSSFSKAVPWQFYLSLFGPAWNCSVHIWGLIGLDCISLLLLGRQGDMRARM